MLYIYIFTKFTFIWKFTTWSYAYSMWPSEQNHYSMHLQFQSSNDLYNVLGERYYDYQQEYII